MPSRDRPEDKLPGRAQPGGTRTDLKAEPTKVTGPLLTADESDEAGDDDEPLFSDEAPPARPRLADAVADDGDDDDEGDDDDDDDGGFLEGRTVAESGALPDGPTRVTVTPQAEPSLPAERTVVATIDFDALHGGGADEPSEFDAPTTLSGEEVPGTSPTASGPVAVPMFAEHVGPDDATVRQPVAPPRAPDNVSASPASAAAPPTTTLAATGGPASTGSPLATWLAQLPPLSPAAYMGVGFAAATVLGLGLAFIWSLLR